MKRNENIQALSRDHHFGLLFCWKIQKGLTSNVEIERINRYVNYFWETNLHQHFLEEETILFHQLHDRFCDDAIREHKAIALQINKINNKEKLNPKAYADLAMLVNRHIRFEERILFPHLENTLSANQLRIIGLELAELHQKEAVDDYEDEFWS
jgi:hemerythrin-like domain-containing protein